MYLLDTNIISELRLLPKNRANANFVAWASQFPDDRIFYINSVVVMELERGVMLKQRKDPEQGNILANSSNNIQYHHDLNLSINPTGQSTL